MAEQGEEGEFLSPLPISNARSSEVRKLCQISKTMSQSQKILHKLHVMVTEMLKALSHIFIGQSPVTRDDFTNTPVIFLSAKVLTSLTICNLSISKSQ